MATSVQQEELGSVSYTLKLPLTLEHHGRYWVAHCPPLDVMAQSSTKKGAKESLKEAVSLWVESCHHRGVLEEALIESGFTRQAADEIPEGKAGVIVRTAKPKDKSHVDHIQVDVPAFIASRLTNTEGHAAC